MSHWHSAIGNDTQRSIGAIAPSDMEATIVFFVLILVTLDMSSVVVLAIESSVAKLFQLLLAM